MSKQLRQPFRYFGSKWRLVPKIDAYAPPAEAIDVFLDLCAGSGSMTIRRERTYMEVLNDTDREVANALRVLREPALAQELARLLALTPYSRAEYNYVRDALAHQDRPPSPVERARQFFIYQNMSISGGRTRSGEGWRASINPHGRYRLPAHAWARLPDVVLDVAERLRGVYVEQMDVLDFIAKYSQSSRVYRYFDPVYLPTTRNKKDRYSQDITGEWGLGKHRAVAEALQATPGYTIVSHYDCDEYRDLYPGWPVVHLAATANGAGKRVEAIYIDPELGALHGLQPHSTKTLED